MLKNIFKRQHVEKRKSLRAEDVNLIKYKLVSSEGKHREFNVTNIKDIGEGGVSFWVHEHLPVASLIELKIILLPIASPISTLAKVVWVKKIGMGGQYKVGAKFIDAEDAVRKIIAEKVKSGRK